jgi:hypothetical protein
MGIGAFGIGLASKFATELQGPGEAPPRPGAFITNIVESDFSVHTGSRPLANDRRWRPAPRADRPALPRRPEMDFGRSQLSLQVGYGIRVSTEFFCIKMGECVPVVRSV